MTPKDLAKAIENKTVGELQIAAHLSVIFPGVKNKFFWNDLPSLLDFFKFQMPEGTITYSCKGETAFVRVVRRERIPGVGEINNNLAYAIVDPFGYRLATLIAILYALD